MKPELKDCIHTNRIDSYQKLRLLLLFHKQPELVITKTELARQLHLDDLLLLGQLVADLQQFGWLDDVEGYYTLSSLPKHRTCLQILAQIFDDPIARQELLEEVWHYPILSTDESCTEKQGECGIDIGQVGQWILSS